MTTPSETSTPLVSAVLIFLNGAAFLGHAIESVRAQSYGTWELVLVDDGSTDGASEIARGYAAREPERIRYVTHPGGRNRGMSASRNLGIISARGTLVAFLDGDDVWMPEKLERQVAIMREHPDADATFGSTHVWFGWTGRDEDAARDTLRIVLDAPDGLYRAPDLLRRYLREEMLTPATCSVLFRRRALSTTGGFEERFTGLYEDQAFFVKAYLKLSCYVTRDAFDRYRQHPDSHSAAALRAGRYSMERPTPALFDLYVWCARYFVREHVVDRALWSALGVKLRGIWLHSLGSTGARVMEKVNPTARRVYAAYYRLRRALTRGGS